MEPVKFLESEIQGRIHYIPYHAVVRTDKSTTKIRIVYDASAKDKNGTSFNNCLHKGLKFDQNIINILIRFSVHRVAFSSDIEKTFLMVGIDEEDQNVLEFLWVDNINSSTPKIFSLHFTRVVFGVTASSFLLNTTIIHHLNKYKESDPVFVEKLSRSIYVDDVTSGAENPEDAYKFYEKCRSRLMQGGFKLKRFTSNSS